MFKFALKTVLNHRRGLKNKAQIDFSEVQEDLNTKLNEIENMYNSISRARKKSEQKIRDGAQSLELLNIEDFIAGQKIKIENKRNETRELMHVLEQKREIMIEKIKDYKSLIILKNKKKKLYELNKKMKERKEIDNLVTMTYHRGKNEKN